MSEAYKQLLKNPPVGLTEAQDRIQKAIDEAADLKRKEYEIHKARVETQHQHYEERKRQQEAAKSIRIDLVPPEYYERLRRENTEYFQLAKESPRFLNTDFEQFVPYFARNLILIGAKSGNGKSTIAGNLAENALRQGKKVLIITNEEIDSDVFNRVTCLLKGWSYTNHKKFTQEQIDTFNEFYEKLGAKLTVVSDFFGGEGGKTTTLEGMKSILNSLPELETKYEVIIIDYFQNISMSLENPHLREFEVLDEMAKFLDGFRKRYNAPIVVLSQLKSDEDLPFKERIERCKAIYNKCTCALEVVADPEHSTTIFGIHKSRFSGGIGKNITVGYDHGRFVKYDKDFIEKMHKATMEKLNKTEQTKFMEDVMKQQ